MKKITSVILGMFMLTHTASAAFVAPQFWEENSSTEIKATLNASGTPYNVLIEGDLQVDGTLTVAAISMTGDLDMDSNDILNIGHAFLNDGLVGTPSLAFQGDPDTGVYLVGAGNIGVALSGVKNYDFAPTQFTISGPADLDHKIMWRENSNDGFSLFYEGSAGLGTANRLHIRSEIGGQVRNLISFNPAGQSLFFAGTVALPTMSFVDDPDTGLYSIGANNLGIAAGGVKALDITATGATLRGTLTVAKNDGTVPLTLLSQNETIGTGTWLTNNASASKTYITNGYATGIQQAAAFVFNVGASGTAGNPITWSEKFRISEVGQARFVDGLVGAPAISFASDLDTGFYSIAGNSVGLATNGVLAFKTDTVGSYFKDGAAATPSLSFIQDTDTGLYRPSANELGFATGGTVKLLLVGDQTRVKDGTVSLPGLSFQDDVDTGLYRVGANRLGLSAGGAIKAETNAAGLALTPSSTTDIVAGTGITVTNATMRVQGSGGAVTVTATPSIATTGLQDGQIVIIQGDSDTNTLKLQDEAQLASSGLALTAGTDFTLGKGDTLTLTWDAGDSKFYELSRSDN